MERPLDGKVAIVTGGTRGIGKGITDRLIKDGAVVVAGFREHADIAHEVADRPSAQGRVYAVQADLSRLGGVRHLFAEAVRLAGGLDILVNNAGVQRRGNFADTTEEDFDTTMALNVKGVFFALQEAVHRMRDGGRIVNISSAATALAQPALARSRWTTSSPRRRRAATFSTKARSGRRWRTASATDRQRLEWAPAMPSRLPASEMS
jgi:3-oxoacyl-[acyl-carrier protein] reductase